jgi:three-Cys-motif partner protein
MNDKMGFSSIDNLPVRPSGSWIERKYHYLRRYLDILTKGMGRKWALTYIDLFPGPGRCLIKNTGEERDGSALTALGFNFKRYIFCEQDPDYMAALKERCRRSPKFNTIKFVQGDCNQTVRDIHLDGLSMAFVDPTGIDIHFDTIQTLSKNRRVDLLMTVMEGMDIKRNLERYRKDGDQSDLGKFVGGAVPWERLQNSRDVMTAYREQLKTLGYDTVEYKDIFVRNDKNVPLYFLMFASKHHRGLEFWNKISTEDEYGQRELF